MALNLLKNLNNQWLELFPSSLPLVLDGNVLLEVFTTITPKDVQVVIIIQEVKNVVGFPNFNKIFENLSLSNLRPIQTKSNDIKPWFIQGVLIVPVESLNENVSHIWQTIINEFIVNFTSSRNGLHYLLWGTEALRYKNLAILNDHKVYEWTYPSQEIDDSLPANLQFLSCRHFEEVNRALTLSKRRPIVWHNMQDVIVFTDGGCPLNGQPDARASFSVLLNGNQYKAAVIRGEIQPFEYTFIDPENLALGIKITETKLKLTNNRGELSAIVIALLTLVRSHAQGNVEIVSDSKISLMTLSQWYPDRLEKNTAQDMKNYDLICIAWKLLMLLRIRCVVKFTHVKSHQKKPSSDANARERFLHRGNEIVDMHCTEVFKTPPSANIEYVNSSYLVQKYL